MRDSDTWMAIFDEGRLDAVKRALIGVGTKRFGPPDEATKNAVAAMTDLDRLERLCCDHVLIAKSWQELLATP